MRVAERATPVAAVIAALSTLACCLPFGFLGEVDLAGLSVWARSYAGGFLAFAAVLLVLGFAQLYRGRNQCRKAHRVNPRAALGWAAVLSSLPAADTGEMQSTKTRICHSPFG
jgi:hypothetical protein